MQKPSTGLYGNEREEKSQIYTVDPRYSASASFSRAAAECSMGTLVLANTEPTIRASRSVHVPDWDYNRGRYTTVYK